VTDVLALGGASFESGQERLGDFLVSGLCEEQRDIDVDTFFERLAYGGEAFGRAGNLIMTFGRSTAFHRRRASASDAFVSKPRKGETSRLT